MKKNFYLLIFIFFSIIGCSYEFSSDYYNDIEMPSGEETKINLINFTNLDTINIKTQMQYTFEGTSNQYKILSEVYLDDEITGSSWSNDIGMFTLFPSRYDDGIHAIRIEHSFTSGSGSMADQAGLEILKKIENFQFVVHRKPSLPPAIIEAIIKEGSIHLKWDPANNLDYKNAFLSLKFNKWENKVPLTKEMFDYGSYIDISTVLFTGNSNSLNYNDYSKVTYSILFTNEYTESYGSNKTLTYDSSWFNMTIAYNNAESYKIKWSSHPLYANFDTFEFGAGSQTFLGSSKGGEYTINSPYIFGKKYGGHATVKQNGDNLMNYNFYEIDLDEGTFGLFDFNHLFSKDILYNPDTKQYYALIIEDKTNTGYSLYIYQYSESMEFIKKTYITETKSHSHRMFKLYIDPINHDFYLDSNFSSYLLEKNNLSILKKYPDQVDYSSFVSLRSNILKTWNYLNNQVTITNIETDEVIYSGESVQNGHFLSRDGRYVYLKNSSANAIYRVINNHLEKIIDTNANSVNMQFEDDTLFYTVGNEVFIVDLNTKIIKTFTFGSYWPSIQYDPLSQQLLLTQNGYNGIYSLETEQIKLFKSETYKNSTGEFVNEDRDYNLHLQNGRIIHSKGIYLDNF